MLDRRRLLLLTVLVATVAAMVPVFGVAQDAPGSHARIVRISYVQGSVQFNGAAAVMNQPVTEDSRLVTGSDGLAEVQFEDGSAVRLASETEIAFAQLARLSTGEAMTRIDLEEGEGEFLIPASSAGRFAVNTRGKNILFKQPGRFRVLSTRSAPLEIAVWKGEASVRDLESGLEAAVKDHETFTLNPDDPGQYDLESSVLGDDLDKWSVERDEVLRSNYVTSSASSNSVYDVSGSSYLPAYVNTYSSFGGCPYGYGYWQNFWLTSPGYCYNTGFYYPWFFARPVFIVVAPINPRHPPVIHPHPIPVVAGVAPVTGTARPGVRSLRFDGSGQRIFNDQTFRRSVPRPENVPVQPVTESQTQGTAVAPGHHSGAAQVHAPPVQQPSHTQHSSPASVPHPGPASHPAPAPHSSSSGSHGFSGGSHSSAPASHSGGRSK